MRIRWHVVQLLVNKMYNREHQNKVLPRSVIAQYFFYEEEMLLDIKKKNKILSFPINSSRSTSS